MNFELCLSLGALSWNLGTHSSLLCVWLPLHQANEFARQLEDHMETDGNDGALESKLML